jgi:hypothetical protein
MSDMAAFFMRFDVLRSSEDGDIVLGFHAV